MFEKINFNKLIEKVVKEKCEITISIDAEKSEINIQPWEPFRYSCPYKTKNDNEI